MTWELFYFDEALLDIRDAKKWYFQQQKGLEKRFADDIKRSLSHIQKDPLHYEVRYKSVRLAHCNTFPYSIHFYIDEPTNRVVIIAIIHQHRHPEYTKERQ
ncbi:MAG: type II toxin-antitoxin system RelE/ParE family toxin [Mucilaginibacter sp.]